jgi:3-methyl-2-oxobutanoate hydroxymethyltransferase
MTTVLDVRRFKREGRRFAMLTAYDFTTAQLLDRAGIPILLVGDSLGNTMLGYATTVPVTLDDVIHHARAVVRGTADALVVADLPFLTFQISAEEAMHAAKRLLQEGGVHAVKVEGAGPTLAAVERLTEVGIPVMAHLGLTPQSVHALGGFRVQGRKPEAAERMLEDAHRLERAGAFSLVLEAVPAEVARSVTEALTIPTIGIGAGPDCDGQVLVVHDLLGLTTGKTARFVKRYANLGETIVEAAGAFAREVEDGEYPGAEHSYSTSPEKERRE